MIDRIIICVLGAAVVTIGLPLFLVVAIGSWALLRDVARACL